MEKKDLIAFDFFCGAGGFSLGLIQAGFKVIGAMDIDFYAMLTYLVNLGEKPVQIYFTSDKYAEIAEKKMEKYYKKLNKKQRGVNFGAGEGWIKSERERGNIYPGVKNFFFGDINEVSGYTILEKLGLYPGDIDLIVGGPPCQGFSKTNMKREIKDIRNKLIIAYAEKINQMKPKTFVMEEVPNVLNMKLENGNNYIEEFMKAIKAKEQDDDIVRKMRLYKMQEILDRMNEIIKELEKVDSKKILING